VTKNTGEPKLTENFLEKLKTKSIKTKTNKPKKLTLIIIILQLLQKKKLYLMIFF